MGRLRNSSSIVTLYSLTTQKLTCLPTPPKDFFEKAKRIITQFIWNNKKPKIAYDKLIQPINKGGLRLANLETKEKALKVSWVKKAQNNENKLWKRIASEVVKEDIVDFWESNLHKRDTNMLKYKGQVISVLQSIANAWATLSYHMPQTKIEVFDQRIWYNSHLRRNNVPLKGGKIKEKGINYVRDVYSVIDNTFITFKQAQEKYGDIGNFLDYIAMLKIIEAKWGPLLEEKIVEKNSSNLHFLNIMVSKDKVSKWAYECIIENKGTNTDGCRMLWNRDLDIRVTQDQWQNMLLDAHYLTMSTKLKWFQYKVINRKLTTNVTINRWNKEIESNCSFCKKQRETVMHLLYECNEVTKLWRAMEKWFKKFLKIEINVTKEVVLLNNHRGKDAQLVNTCILIAKQRIYAAKCMTQKSPSFIEITTKIHELYKDEEFIAKKNKKVSKHKQKWNKYIQAMLCECEI